MPSITVNTPTANSEFYATFKEPFNTYIKNKFNLENMNKKLKVVSIINMKDMIRNDLKDPFTELYLPLGISEIEYKKDLNENIPIITLMFIDDVGVERYFRIPLNYIESISQLNEVEYINKLIVIDLNRLPSDLDLTVFFNDLKDFIESRVGIIPQIKEVSIGSVELVSQEEHEIRETVRMNSITVYKTLSAQLEDLNLRFNSLLARVNALGIVLGE